VEFDEVVRRRRMTRRFDPAPVPAGVRDRLLAAALTAPSAGFSQGVDLLVLESPEARGAFFESTTDAEWRTRRGGSAEGILAAPLVVVPVADPEAYVHRYGLPDKAASGLAGRPAEAWPVPYWLVDAAFASMILLLSATREGLGALFFRLHRDTATFLAGAGVPPGRLTIGAIAVGWPDAAGERRRPRRAARPAAERIHLGGW
jgi:nitroreductase